MVNEGRRILSVPAGSIFRESSEELPATTTKTNKEKTASTTKTKKITTKSRLKRERLEREWRARMYLITRITRITHFPT